MAGTDQEFSPGPHLTTQMATLHPQRDEPLSTTIEPHEDDIFSQTCRPDSDGFPFLQGFFDRYPVQYNFIALEDGHIGRQTRAAI